MDLELRSLNILIGANGAGKSDLISFFKLLNEIMSERLQLYIGISGRAQSMLYFGSKITPQIEAKLEFEYTLSEKIDLCEYEFKLIYLDIWLITITADL